MKNSKDVRKKDFAAKLYEEMNWIKTIEKYRKSTCVCIFFFFFFFFEAFLEQKLTNLWLLHDKILTT